MKTTHFCQRGVAPFFLAVSLLLSACASNDETDAEHSADTSEVETRVEAVADSAPIQSFRDDASTAAAEDRQAYDVIVDRIKARGFQSDFTLLRSEYINTSLYNPFDARQRDAARAMFEALDANKLKQCVKHANTILDINFTHLAAHAGAAICYGKLDESDQQEMHRRIYDGLINAIAATGNGRTPQTAFVVISVDEIYDFLQSQDLEIVKQRLMDSGGRKFDVMNVRDPRTGRNFDVYFDISAEQNYFANKLQR